MVSNKASPCLVIGYSTMENKLNLLRKMEEDEFDDIQLMNAFESELEKHMKSFDNLGFDNQRVYNWHKSILEALEADGFVMSDFYFTNMNTNNSILFQHIAFKENTYDFLTSKGLVNRGYCPITGEQIDNTYNFNIFGRVVYLSAKGLEACENIKRNEWNDTFQDHKKRTRGFAYIFYLNLLFWGAVILLCFKHC